MDKFSSGYYEHTDDGRGGYIIRSIDQEPVRPDILPALPEKANVLSRSRCSTKDRDNALNFLTEMHAEGYISAEELEVRRAHVLESATHQMLVRVTSDFPEAIDKWLYHQAQDEQRRKEAAKPAPPAEPKDETIPAYGCLALGLGILAVFGGMASIYLRSPVATGIAIAIMGIAIIAVAAMRQADDKK